MTSTPEQSPGEQGSSNIEPEDWTDKPTGRGGNFPTDPLDGEAAAEREDEGEATVPNRTVSGGGEVGENLGASEAQQENSVDTD